MTNKSLSPPSIENIKNYLLENLCKEASFLWGEKDLTYLNRVAEDWLDTGEASVSRYRIEKIRMLNPSVFRILDIGAGCGTFVFYALSHGYDAYGIEPSAWKLEVGRRWGMRYVKGKTFRGHIIASIGEHLPFEDDSFDCVTSFQTMEHVKDVYTCCEEMLRVCRPGGCIYIRCPDYDLSTFEGHYRLPWLPQLKGKYAEKYLSFLKKPLIGLRSLKPVSMKRLQKTFVNISERHNIKLRIVNIDTIRIRNILHTRNQLFVHMLTNLISNARFITLLFRIEYPVNMGVLVDSK